MTRRCVAVLLGLLVVLAAACGNDTVDGTESGSDDETRTTEGALDTTPAEQQLVARQRQATPDLNVGEARCHTRAELREGATFGCSVQVEGLPAPYTVTVTDVDRDAKTAEYEFELTKAIVSTAKARDAVKQSWPDQSAQVDCGFGKVRLAEIGTTIECSVNDKDGFHSATVRVVDIQGNVTRV
ncbi:MAG TPA: DUF4333 domain-containing protein [Acidimicrobiales bacterium]|nr:DUF4333 domain-containing protein [Acidimicrobiales bacterium]